MAEEADDDKHTSLSEANVIKILLHYTTITTFNKCLNSAENYHGI
jgi:hypothetical protein